LILEHVNIHPFVGNVIVDPRPAAAIHFYVTGRLLEQHVDVAGLQGALTGAPYAYDKPRHPREPSHCERHFGEIR
jgi:hypothetical protein